MHQHTQLDRIEALIAALKRERDTLERRLVSFRSQQDFLDGVSRWYFNLWRLKWESGLEIFSLPPDHRELLGNLLGHDVIAQHHETIEDELSRLVSEGRYVTFAEIEGLLQIIDGIIDGLENLRGQVARRERSAIQRANILCSKVIRVCGGGALIGLDLPIQNWLSVIGGAILISTTVLKND